MRPLSTRAFTGAIAALGVILTAYLIAVWLPPDGTMIAPLQKAFPRTADLVRQVPNPRSFLLSIRKPVSSAPLYRASPTPQARSFSTTARMTHDTLTFKDAILNRRTFYQLTNKSTISDERIKEILTTAVKHVPSSFNSQSARLVVLLKDQHEKFWDTVTEILKAHVPEDKWEYTGARMAMFRAAYGTVLFYEDPEPIKTLQSKFAQYADKFPQWSEHTSAMHQYTLWTAFEAEGLGCNLQHYNPLPNQKASEIWNVPLEWDLKAQLVFGEPAEGARATLPEKAFEPVEKRLFIHGA